MALISLRDGSKTVARVGDVLQCKDECGEYTGTLYNQDYDREEVWIAQSNTDQGGQWCRMKDCTLLSRHPNFTDKQESGNE